jgi:hypothetical protein
MHCICTCIRIKINKVYQRRKHFSLMIDHGRRYHRLVARLELNEPVYKLLVQFCVLVEIILCIVRFIHAVHMHL